MDLKLEITTAQNVPLALEPASLGERILATIIDTFVIGAYALVMVWLLGTLEILTVATGVLLIALPLGLYHLACEVLLHGRTLGKMAVKTRVARLDGAQPSLGQYLLRWLLRIVDVTFSSGMVALLSIALTRRQQRLGDLAAGTSVVRQRRRVLFEHVLYPQIPAGYEPQFPEAEALTDPEVRTLRAVITKLRLTPRNGRSSSLAKRAKAAVEKRLGLETVQMPPDVFLRTIVRDHVACHDRFL